jgi:hypothetical protein
MPDINDLLTITDDKGITHVLPPDLEREKLHAELDRMMNEGRRIMIIGVRGAPNDMSDVETHTDMVVELVEMVIPELAMSIVKGEYRTTTLPPEGEYKREGE